MNRDQHLDAAVRALAPVDDLLAKTRVGIDAQFNPLMVQIAMAFAQVHVLAALAASDQAVRGEVLTAVLEGGPGIDVPPAQVPEG